MQLKKICLYLFSAVIMGCGEQPAAELNPVLVSPSIAPLTDSIAQFPNDDNLYFKRAVQLNAQNEIALALQDFEKAWELKKDEKYAIGVGNLLLEKNISSAIHFFQEALVSFPNSVLLKTGLARSYSINGDFDQSLALIDEVLKVDSSQIGIRLIQADLMEKKGNAQQALAILEKAYSQAPYNEQLVYQLALKYAENKNPQVLKLTDSLIQHPTQEKNAAPYYYKGIYFTNINDTTRALAAFDKAIQTDYNFKEAYIEKGTIYYKSKQYQKALPVFQLAITISPSFADGYFWVAKTQESLGALQDAKINYERAFGLDNSFTEAKEAAKKLPAK